MQNQLEEEIMKFRFSKAISATKLKAISKSFSSYDKYLRDRKEIFLNEGAQIGSLVDDIISGTYKDENYVFIDFEPKIDANKKKTKIFKVIYETVKEINQIDKLFSNKPGNIWNEEDYAINGKSTIETFKKYLKKFDLYQSLKDEDKIKKKLDKKLFEILVAAAKGKKYISPIMKEKAKKAKINITENKIYQELIGSGKVSFQKILYGEKNEMKLKGALDLFIETDEYSNNIVVEMKYIYDLEESLKSYYNLRYYIQSTLYKYLATEDYQEVDFIFMFYNEHGVSFFKETSERKNKNIQYLNDAIELYKEYKKHSFNRKNVLGSKIRQIK